MKENHKEKLGCDLLYGFDLETPSWGKPPNEAGESGLGRVMNRAVPRVWVPSLLIIRQLYRPEDVHLKGDALF